LVEGKAPEFELGWRTWGNCKKAIRHFAERRKYLVLPSQVVQLAV
jgi:hypothetical protein